MLQETYTAKELSGLFGIAVKNVLARAARENWQRIPRAKKLGGDLFKFSSMPDSTKAAIAAAVSRETSTLPAIVSASEAVIPDWAFTVAKARFRIVMEWRSFVASAVVRGEKKLEASEQFFVLLEAGAILPADVLKKIGQYSLSTIYRWDKELRENNNKLDALADKRGGWQKGGAKGLGQLGAEAEALLLGAWLTPNQPSMQLAYNSTAKLLQKRGLPVPSYTSARRFLKRYEENHKDIVTLKRKGEKALRDTVGPYISRNDKLLNVGDVLFSDGHVLNFTSLNPITGKECRLTLIVWFDWRSRMPVGWEVMPEETALAISSALHMGIRNLGKYPKVVYIDNGKAFRAKYFNNVSDFQEMDGLYVRCGIDVQYSKPYAAQTKIIERFWGTFNEQCARLLPSYCGNSIDDKPAYMKRAENYHKARHSDFVPTIRETAEIFSKFVNWYSQNPHDGLDGATPWSVFEPGRGTGVDVAELDRHFLLRKEISPKRTGFIISGIRFESDALYGLEKKVLATYSWADLSEVALFDIESGVRIGTARPVESLNPLARVFGDELDMLKVQAANKRQQSLRRSTMQLAKELDGNDEALKQFPWMLPASERRTPVVIPSGNAAPKITQKSLPPATPEISQAEEAELQALAAKLKAEKAAKPAYDVPAFFASELERYDFLFNLSVAEGVMLAKNDADFMKYFENTPAYAPGARRYADMRALFERRAKQQQEQVWEATA